VNQPALLNAPPDEPRVTAYDLSHKVAYLRLLDAAAEGADWREVARLVLGLDPDRHPEQARRIHDSHLARARWMTEAGYRDLLRHGTTN
jgi:predicted SprT family Zn-dependent metalloprotease